MPKLFRESLPNDVMNDEIQDFEKLPVAV